jgi:hypothetical protein
VEATRIFALSEVTLPATSVIVTTAAYVPSFV